jgi:hypothetical protein
MILVAIHRHGACKAADVQKHVPLAEAVLEQQLARLVATGRLLCTEAPDGARYSIDRIFIPHGAGEGWEAAVLDHYQAMIAAICGKLRGGDAPTRGDESIGGSTYHLDVWEGHPLEREALGFLASIRRQGVALRTAVEAHNAAHARPADATEIRVTSYVGQAVLIEGEDDET